MFGEFGEVRNVKIFEGFGFIEYNDSESASKAKDELHETDIFGTGRTIRVNFAKPRGDRGGGGGEKGGGWESRGWGGRR